MNYHQFSEGVDPRWFLPGRLIMKRTFCPLHIDSSGLNLTLETSSLVSLKIVSPLNDFFFKSSIRFCPFNCTLSNVLSDKNNVLNVLFDLVNMIINGPNGFPLSV